MSSGPNEIRNPAQPATRWQRWALTGILLCALLVRLYGIDWDAGLQFHPDERQLLMVVDELSFPWPPDGALLSSPDSPWNPGFFSYGSLPIYLLRVVTDLAAPVGRWFDLSVEPLYVGRVLSALADTLTVLLVYLLGKRLRGANAGLLAAGLTAATVLHIQLAHFYTVDTLLTALVMLTLYLLLRAMERPSAGRAALVGGVLGLAVATKLSAAPLGLCVFLGFSLVRADSDSSSTGRRLLRAVGLAAISAGACLMVFALCEPYALIDWSAFTRDALYESGMASGLFDVPYTRQFLGTRAYWYQLEQAVVWSAGIALGLTALIGAFVEGGLLLWRWIQRQPLDSELAILLVWMLLYVAIIGRMQARFLRYMLPVLPLWSLLASLLLTRLLRAPGRWRQIGQASAALVLVSTGLYAAAYVGMYAEPHPWVQTTSWFNERGPGQVIVLAEAWDDNVPVLRVTDWDWSTEVYWISFDSYGEDSPDKMHELANKLATADYVVLSSQRLYATIGRLPERYPLTRGYFLALFEGELGYELEHVDARYPSLFGLNLVNDTFVGTGLPVPELVERERGKGWVIGRADESYDVYDHPLTLVFHNVGQLSVAELYQRLSPGSQLP